jgi:hypothetical protein
VFLGILLIARRSVELNGSEQHTFGAKALAVFAGFMRGLKPPPPSKSRACAICLLVGGGGDFALPVGGFEEFAGAGAVGGTDQAVVFHHVDEVGGAAVTDSETAL